MGRANLKAGCASQGQGIEKALSLTSDARHERHEADAGA